MANRASSSSGRVRSVAGTLSRLAVFGALTEVMVSVGMYGILVVEYVLSGGELPAFGEMAWEFYGARSQSEPLMILDWASLAFPITDVAQEAVFLGYVLSIYSISALVAYALVYEAPRRVPETGVMSRV